MIVDNNEEITTGNDGTEMCSSGADVAVEMCSPESHDTYRVRGCTTSGGYVEILGFRHFEKFFRFDQSDRKTYKKSISDGVNVSVVLNVVTGNTSKREL